MKKYITNLKKSVPPKARIAIIAALGGMSVISYLVVTTIAASSEDDTPAENGFVAIETNISPNSEISSNPLLASNNKVNDEIDELRRQSIKSIKESKGSESHIDPINLSSKEDLESKESENVDDRRNDVIDLGDLFKETEADRAKREEKKDSEIAKLKGKLKPENPVVQSNGTGFDRSIYLTQVETEISSAGTGSSQMSWDRPNKSTMKMTSYAGISTSAEKDNSTSSKVSDSSISSKEFVTQRREQYLARYNDMKTDLESRMSGNTKVVESSHNKDTASNGAEQDAENNQTYSSNETYGAGEVIYGINDIEIVSDESNVVRVTLAQNGDTYNAILLGSFTQVGDVIGLKFNSYTVDHKSYAIDAIAIDAETWKSGLADDVEHHYISRYLGIVTAALLEGYAETLSDTSTTNTESGVTESSERIESVSERLQAAVGNVGTYLAPKMLENVDRESTVTVYRDKGMGIMLMSDFRVPARN
jgi:hypothetical protein